MPRAALAAHDEPRFSPPYMTRTAADTRYPGADMKPPLRAVIFLLDGQRYALPLTAVERIVRAVEVVALPGAPHLVLGIIDMGGRVLPVISLRRRFSLPDRQVGVTDQFLIANTAARTVALVIDDAAGVIVCEPSAIAGAESIGPGMESFEGVVKLEDGLVLIHDLTKLLSLDEIRALEAALSDEEHVHDQR
jgi:purine-binding chemotaxis protein CheW